MMDFEKFRQDLIDIINDCGLPVGGAYYVVKDVLRELEKVYIAEMNQVATESYTISEGAAPIKGHYEDGTELTQEQLQNLQIETKEEE